jgi:hypothetical protein
MDIVIPSYLRPRAQFTYQRLKRAGVKSTVVVRQGDYPEYRMYIPEEDLHAIQAEVSNIGETRDYIVNEMPGGTLVLMLDDDLDFAARRSDDPTKFRDCTDDDIECMVRSLDDLLEKFPHVSIAAREGANRNTDHFMVNTRMMRVLGYNRAYLRKHDLKFTPTNFMCDFHMTLQILKLGNECCVQNGYVSNQRGGSNATGGCSTTRTEAAQSAEAVLLARLHAPFVKVVQKPSWSGVGTRDDVVVQWKQAYQWGVQNARKSA